ncbi:hypothetical protein E8E12_001455 [Didymella heteroderae]|uniref:Uncharacterized protein n=1 Tax=Didymella heteroderae TaxID=1769908 RepID=A0A9P4WG30_9PLEO|nr:hypothetical protein E8E12_001455 [Didymella heteroderae]
MAHQACSIPWQTLVDNLKFMHCSPRNRGITNLYLRKRPNQYKELQYFANGFARALSNYSAIERRKYNAPSTSPAIDERVISQEAVRKMSATVLRYKGQDDASHSIDASNEALSEYECMPHRFISDTYPCESDMHDGIEECCEQTKTMLMYGEMEALFRLAAHPDVHFDRLWDEDIYANGAGFGLRKLMDAMLQAYLCLNVLVLKPELWDPASRGVFLRAEGGAHRTTFPPEAYDYRLTAAYQRMLVCCTGIPYGAYHYEAHTYPHRDFFGIPRGMFRFDDPYQGQKTGKPGTGRVVDVAEKDFRHIHLASKADVDNVIDVLRKKGLPTELALQILEWAEYKSTGRLWHRDDPLHAKNAVELTKYLRFCWKVLVRIDMLVQDCGKTLDWASEVADAMCVLFELGKNGRPKGLRQRAMCDWAEFGKRSERVGFVSQ